ncbi:MAG: AsmA-like C-terminal region-containing protein, partial [Gammaproteobacteria bacterium]
IRDESNLSGTGNFEISLSGIGGTFGDVLASTAGRVDFSLRDGIVRGVNIGHALCDVYNTIEQVPGPRDTNDLFTVFDLMRGSAIVTDGIARTGDLQASTSFMDVNGRGQLDLTNQDINFDLVATVTDRIEIDGCQTMDPLVGDSLPLRLTGNLAAPVVRPDFQEIIRNRARESLEERFQERLGEELQELLSN